MKSRKLKKPLAYDAMHYDAPYFVCPDCKTKQTLNPAWEGKTGAFKCKGCGESFNLVKLDEAEPNLWDVKVSKG